jgi:type IV pilus assembly protein PilB
MKPPSPTASATGAQRAGASAETAEPAAPKKKLGEKLVDAGLISADQLKIALFEQQRSHKPLGEVLVSLGFVTEETFREALS